MSGIQKDWTLRIHQKVIWFLKEIEYCSKDYK